MKKLLTFLFVTAMTALLVTLFFSSIYAETVIFEENFEDCTAGDLNGQFGWTGGTTQVGPGSYLESMVAYGGGDTVKSFSPGLSLSNVYILTVDAYATSAPRAHNSAVIFTSSEVGNQGGWWMSNNPGAGWPPYTGGGWIFDPRYLTGVEPGSTDNLEYFDGGYDKPVTLKTIIDPVNLEVYGIADLGDEIVQTTHYTMILDRFLSIEGIRISAQGGGEFDNIKVTAGPEPTCGCEMTPTTTTITRGQKLEIDVTVTNNTGYAGTIAFGAKVTKPDATTTGWVHGPQEFFIAAYGQQSGYLSHDVPTSWPVGTYTYHGYVGIPGVAIYCESQFDFVVATGVPKTGQTTSYATGDDGDLQKGTAWPNPRFTDNGNGTVTDNMTGLIWLKDADCFVDGTWAEALSDCNSLAAPNCGLTDSSVAGDWRLPSIKELESLIDFGFWSPALPNTAGTGQWTEGDPFTSVLSNDYWSGTTYENDTNIAWCMTITSGHVAYGSKSNHYSIWPVRGPE